MTEEIVMPSRKKPPHLKRKHTVMVRMTEGEKKEVEREAKKQDTSLGMLLFGAWVWYKESLEDEYDET